MAERQIIFQARLSINERPGRGKLPSSSSTEPSSEVETGENLLRNGLLRYMLRVQSLWNKQRCLECREVKQVLPI